MSDARMERSRHKAFSVARECLRSAERHFLASPTPERLQDVYAATEELADVRSPKAVNADRRAEHYRTFYQERFEDEMTVSIDDVAWYLSHHSPSFSRLEELSVLLALTTADTEKEVSERSRTYHHMLEEAIPRERVEALNCNLDAYREYELAELRYPSIEIETRGGPESLDAAADLLEEMLESIDLAEMPYHSRAS